MLAKESSNLGIPYVWVPPDEDLESGLPTFAEYLYHPCTDHVRLLRLMSGIETTSLYRYVDHIMIRRLHKNSRLRLCTDLSIGIRFESFQMSLNSEIFDKNF